MIKFVPYEKENCVEVVAYDGENSIGKASFTVEGCNMNFIEDLESNVLPDFQAFQKEEPEKVKLPD